MQQAVRRQITFPKIATRSCSGTAACQLGTSAGSLASVSAKPTDNGLIESFNGRLRDGFLNVNEFITIHDVHEKIEGLARRPQPLPATRVGRAPDPERVRHNASDQPKEAADL